MLNPFPDLLAFSLLSPLIIRLFVGYQFFLWGYGKIIAKRVASDIDGVKKEWLGQDSVLFYLFGIIQLFGGLFLIIGAYTQYTALMLSAIMLGAIVVKMRQPELLTDSLKYYLLILLICMSLLFTGAGSFAIDIPL
jgi:uncharacterized membrane protein YphA (DoxX/SURF4 family)